MIRKIWQWMKPIFFEEKQEQESRSEENKLTITQWILLVGCIGLGAMMLHHYFNDQRQVQPVTSSSQENLTHEADETEDTEEVFGPSRSSPETMREYERFYENKLKDTLTTIRGVGDVTVFVNLDSTEQIVVEKNVRTQHSQTNEQDREGGSRSIVDDTTDEQVVIIRKNDGDEPVIIMKKKPKVRGVMVVASGAENAQVKAWILEAVQRTLDVPLHRISVLPKN
ncbi:stage III sporulation protein AG [Caldalkalibacillus salinus]|uniref:stage III sporulation protein AG n=1 Tax=Caldalkalibacillus salinus TaxID=2803787 RepID=UPI0019204006|nr:stage III sporulation protein AG [Caldalkalibacillus salinus]